MTTRVLPARQGLREGGFTLIELLVVLTILSLLTALAGPRLSLGAEARFSADVQSLVADLRVLSALARRGGDATSLRQTEGGYRLVPSGRERKIDMVLAFKPAAPSLLPNLWQEVTFFADGSASEGDLIVRRDRRIARIRVRGWDGRIHVADGH